MSTLYNRVRVNTATVGTGTVTLGAATSNAFFTFAEAGVPNAESVPYVIEDGGNVEIGVGTYTSSGTTLSRDTVTASKIAGVAGTTKLTLSGSAIVYIDARAADITVPPASSTNKAIATYNGTTGRAIQNNSDWTINGSVLLHGFTSDIVLDGAVTDVQLVGTGGDWGQTQIAVSNNSTGLALAFAKTRGADPSVNTTVQNGDQLANISGYGNDGTSYVEAFRIIAAVEGSPSTGVMPTRVSFLTNQSGASASLFMRGSATGHLLVGGTGTADRRLHAEHDTSATNSVTYVGRLTATSSGTPAAGIGVGLEFEVETAAGNNEVGATIEAVTSDVTSTSEDFDLLFGIMVGGVLQLGSYAPRTKRCSSTHGVTGVTGTEVTDLQFDSVQPGTYLVEYWILWQSGTATTGIGFGHNFTGTAAVKAFIRYDVSTITTASNGLTEEESGAALVTGGVMNAWATQAYSTTTPTTMSEGVGAINSNVLCRLEGIVIVTAAGDLELWHSSQVAATTTTIQIGSCARLTKVA